MSQENVELARRVYEEFNRTRRGSIEERQRAILSVMEPEVEWHTAPDLPDSRVYRGHDGVAALMQEWVNSFEDFRVDAEEFIDRGEYVVVPLVLRGRIPGSRESDQEVTLPHTHVYKLREGKVVEAREYLTLEQALEAAGLEG
jgi:ketosteroid isomerase-like protein